MCALAAAGLLGCLTSGSALAQTGADAGAEAVTRMLQDNAPMPSIDPMVTGSTGGVELGDTRRVGPSLDVICDRACQLERLDKWRGILAE